MLAQGHGKIINMASMATLLVPHPQKQIAYNASKSAVVKITQVRSPHAGSRHCWSHSELGYSGQWNLVIRSCNQPSKRHCRCGADPGHRVGRPRRARELHVPGHRQHSAHTGSLL